MSVVPFAFPGAAPEGGSVGVAAAVVPQQPEAILKRRKERLKADMTITAADIENMFENFMARRGSRDLNKILEKALEDMTWKTAPNASILADLSDLFSILVEKFPCAMMPPRFTTIALENCDKRCKCNFGNKTVFIWASEVSAIIRCGLSKLRELQEDQTARDTCFKKVYTSI